MMKFIVVLTLAAAVVVVDAIGVSGTGYKAAGNDIAVGDAYTGKSSVHIVGVHDSPNSVNSATIIVTAGQRNEKINIDE